MVMDVDSIFPKKVESICNYPPDLYKYLIHSTL